MAAVAQHHLYSASGSKGWKTCAGKVSMEQGIADTYSPHADLGSAAHYLGGECLQRKVAPHTFMGKTIICWEKEGERDGQVFEDEQPIPEGATERSRWPVDREMVANITAYVNYVKKKVGSGELLVEQRVHFGDAIGVPGAFGTSDVIIIKNKRLIVIDLKYGFGEVSAEENSQMSLYALGALEDLGMFYDLSGIRVIEMVIFQPRLKHEPSCPEWTCSIEHLYKFAERTKDEVERSEEARAFFEADGMQNMPYDKAEWEAEYLKPSDEGCQWCKAKGHCPAVTRQSLSHIVEPATLDGLDDLDSLAELDEGQFVKAQVEQAIARVPHVDFVTLASMYSALDSILDWAKAVEARMYKDMLDGEKHPDWKLVKGKGGNRQWRDQDEVEATMKAMRLKNEEMYDKKLISPTTAESLLKKARPKLWAKLESAITRADGKPVIAPRDDKRPSIDPFNDDLAMLPDFTVDDLLG